MRAGPGPPMDIDDPGDRHGADLFRCRDVRADGGAAATAVCWYVRESAPVAAGGREAVGDGDDASE